MIDGEREEKPARSWVRSKRLDAGNIGNESVWSSSSSSSDGGEVQIRTMERKKKNKQAAEERKKRNAP